MGRRIDSPCVAAIARLVQMRWRIRVYQRIRCQKVVAALMMQAAYITSTPAWKSAAATEMKRTGGKMTRMTVDDYRAATLRGLYLFRGTLNMSIKGRRDQMDKLRNIIGRMLAKMRAKKGTVVMA